MSEPKPELKPIEETVFEELTVAETGTPVEAEITTIISGKCIDFPAVQKIRNEAIKQRWLERGNAECIQITIKVDNTEYTLFPIRKSQNTRSTFYRLFKTYGEKIGNKYVLKPGTKIKVVFTERGFPRIYLP